MTHYSRPHVVFEKLKSRHGSIFDENYDEIQKNLQSFDLVSAKREWRLKRHWPLEGYTFILAPRELIVEILGKKGHNFDPARYRPISRDFSRARFFS